VKLAAFASLLFVLAVTGCYNPKVQNGGFACSATDDPPCPHGFFCVSGLCIDHPGSGGGGGGGGGSGDMAMSISGDMSMSTGDMAHAGDMAHGPGDMAMACGMSGDNCGSSAPCCSSTFCFFGVCF
jgi:hypothetical protein